MDQDTIEALITICPWDSSKNIHAYAKNDGLVILDEVQDFFPPNCKLDADQTEFITQHGQRGIDIVSAASPTGMCTFSGVTVFSA